MDFTLSEAQVELAGLARKILAAHDEPARQWADLAAAGVLAAGLPESVGGAGLGFLEQCSVLGEVGRAASLAPYLASAVLGAGAIAAFGSADQRQRWAVPAGDGSAVVTVALAEEDNDDPAAPAASAARAGKGWLLSGVKTAVPALARAGLVLVPATVRASGPGPVMVFLVAPSDAGVTVQPQALAGDPYAGRLVLDGVRVDDSQVLGDPGHGARVARWLAAHATVGLCATQAGVAERALELTAKYARDREQFGRPIGSFQAVAQRLADAYIDVEAVWLTMWQAAWLLDGGPDGGPDGHPGGTARPDDPDDGEVGAAIATAKFWAADAGHRVAHTAVHVHGGMGIDTSYPLHRYFLAAKQSEFTLGGATRQLLRIGHYLASLARPGRGSDTHVTWDQASKDAYERVIDRVDPVAVIVTCASGGDKAGCLVTFSAPGSLEPPRYAVWLSHRNHTYRVALGAGELIVHLLTPADLPLAELFGGVSGTREDKFARVPWSDHGGTPLLRAGGGWVAGRILSRAPGREEMGGDHTCFVLEPTAAGDGDGSGSGRPLRASDVRHVQPGQPGGE